MSWSVGPVTAVIPAYNAADTLGDVILDVRRALSDAAVVVVDDGSDDDTAAVAAAHDARVGRLERPRGTGAAADGRDGCVRW